MTQFEKIPLEVDVAPLMAALERNPDLWNDITARTGEKSPHREAPDIWVRYNKMENLTDRATVDEEHIPVWYPAWKRLPELKPLLFDLMAFVQGEMLGGVLITKVPAGKKVYPHKDHGWHVEYYDKFYIQLAGAEGCYFSSQDIYGDIEDFCPKAGDVYLYDNRQTHWVTNDSDVDRVTLIVCIRSQKYGRF